MHSHTYGHTYKTTSRCTPIHEYTHLCPCTHIPTCLVSHIIHSLLHWHHFFFFSCIAEKKFWKAGIHVYNRALELPGPKQGETRVTGDQTVPGMWWIKNCWWLHRGMHSRCWWQQGAAGALGLYLGMQDKLISWLLGMPPLSAFSSFAVLLSLAA